MKPALVFAVLFLLGCGGHTKVIAVAQPLEELTEVPAVHHPAADPRLDGEPVKVSGPVVVGSRGEGLNVASSVHQIFLAMGISTEVRCLEQRDVIQPSRVRTQLEIVFPDGLSTLQQRQVRQVLTLIRPTVTLQ